MWGETAKLLNPILPSLEDDINPPPFPNISGCKTWPIRKMFAMFCYEMYWYRFLLTPQFLFVWITQSGWYDEVGNGKEKQEVDFGLQTRHI